MKKRWLIAAVSFLSLAGLLLSSGFGVTSAYFLDRETSSGNVFTAWASRLWTQTTETDFSAGISENVTVVSPGDVKLLGLCEYVDTHSPSTSSGGWTNPANAYADGGGYASITSGTPSASQTYGGYGFNLPTDSTITNVRVRYDAWSVPAMPAFKAAGAFTAGTKTMPAFKAAGAFTAGRGAITPPYPSGAGAPVAGDIAILVCESENQPISLSNAQGFVELGAQANKAAGTPATNPASRLAVYWKRCVGGDIAPTVADSGDHTTGQIYLFSGVKTSGNPWNTYSEGNDGGANDTSGIIPGGTTTVDNCLIFLICTSSRNATSTANFSNWTNADLSSITEIGDNTNNAGLGGGHGSATAVKATAGSFGDTTVTLANTSFKGAMMIALEPEPATITPPYPTGAGAPVAGDIAILVCESENQPISLSNAQGFVELGAQANKAAGTPATNPASRLAVYWKRCVGGDIAPTVADSGDHTTGQIYLFSGVKTSGNPWNTYSEGNDGGANDTSGVIPGGTTTVDNCLIFLICTSSFDGTSTAQFSNWTNAGLSSITEIGDNTNTAGLGGGHGSATAVKATAGSFGDTTVTLANTSFKGAMMIALEPANDQIRVDVSWDGGTNWSSKQVQTLTDTEATYWYDVTGATTWDAAKLNDSNLRVRVDAYTQGTSEEVRLDWLPVEVTYTVPCTGSMTNYPSSSTGGWTNPSNAYADDGAYASITSGTPSASQTYGGYGFNLPIGSAVNSVRVRYDAWSAVPTVVTYNNTTTGAASGNITTCTFAHNVGNQSNKILIVGVSYENGVDIGQEPDTVSNVTYGGVAMTLVNKQRSVSQNNSPPYNPFVQEVSLWYLTDDNLPDDNINRDVVVTVPSNSTNALVCGAISLYNANQAAPTDFGGTANTGANTITKQYTTTVNNTMAVDVVGCGNPGSYTPGDQTERYDTTTGDTMTGAGGTRFIATAGTVTNSWTFSGTDTADRQAMYICGVQSYTEYDDQIRVDVSWDGDTNWSSKAVQTLTDTETTYWYDVTGAPPGGWDATKLNDSNLRVRVDAYTQGTSEEVRLDWLPVEITHATVGGYTSGRIASQVYDTSVVPPPSATWDMLSWDETLPGGTDITFEVRASDTSFLKDSLSPSWISVGGTSPVTSGLPSGRYKQWRATLTTSNPANTPILHEVRVWYDP